MGWNNLKSEKSNCPLLKGVSEQAYMYFVHSYYVVPEDASVIVTTTDLWEQVLLNDLER